MKASLLTTLVLFFSTQAAALPPAPNDGPAEELVFINAHIHVGNGQVLENAQFAIADGKITRAGYYKMRFTGDEIDLQGQHIYPGFILTTTNLGLTEVDSFKATIDHSETGQLNPNVRSLIAYNTDSERIPAMRFNGILLAQTTPSGGLVSGTSSVVQLDAWNWQDAVVTADTGLHVNWPAQWAKRFDWSSFSMQLKEDKKYAEKIDQIKHLFAEAQVDNSGTNLKLNAVKPVFTGEKKVFIHSNAPKAIIESIQYFQSLGLEDLVLVTNQAAEQVLPFIAASGVGVILTAVHTLPHQSDSSIDAAYALPAKLQKAGVLTALSYPGSMSSRNLAFTAGTTVAYGNSSSDALRMITLNPAKILGIEAQYGSLEIGKSATFFISQGDALDMRTNQISAAYIDGRSIELTGRQQVLYERFKEKLQ